MSNIELIILGILATSIMVIEALIGITAIVTAPILGKLGGIVFTAAMVIMIVGLWKLLLN